MESKSKDAKRDSKDIPTFLEHSTQIRGIDLKGIKCYKFLHNIFLDFGTQCKEGQNDAPDKLSYIFTTDIATDLSIFRHCIDINNTNIADVTIDDDTLVSMDSSTGWHAYAPRIHLKNIRKICDLSSSEWLKMVSTKVDLLSLIPESTLCLEHCLAAVRQCHSLQNIPKKYQTRELCMEACLANDENLKYVSEENKSEDLCRTIVKHTMSAFKYVPLKWQLVLLKENSLLLAVLPEDSITNSHYEVLVEQNGDILQYVPRKHCTNATYMKAVKQAGLSALQHVPESERTNEMISICEQK